MKWIQLFWVSFVKLTDYRWRPKKQTEIVKNVKRRVAIEKLDLTLKDSESQDFAGNISLNQW